VVEAEKQEENDMEDMEEKEEDVNTLTRPWCWA